jgi:acyl carrier protein
MTLPSYITPHVHPARRHLIEPDAQLADLGLDLLDLWAIRDDIERGEGMIISDADLAKWQTLADVAETALEGVGG